MIEYNRKDAGWCNVTVNGTYLGSASYLDDVPCILLKTFTEAVEKDMDAVSVSFDAEGSHFGFFIWDNYLYAINTKDYISEDVCKITRLEYFVNNERTKDWIDKTATEILCDVRSQLDEWEWWNPDADLDGNHKEYRKLYIKMCDRLETALRQRFAEAQKKSEN